MKKTTAQINNENLKDTTNYDAMEIAEQGVNTLEKQLQIAIDRGRQQFSENVFSVIMLFKQDPRQTTVLKRVFTASPFMPKPRPDQAVWVYNRITDKLTFMWSLPNAHITSCLSVMLAPPKYWQRTATWCRAFFEGRLVDLIRKETGITLETEREFLRSHREELAKMASNNVE